MKKKIMSIILTTTLGLITVYSSADTVGDYSEERPVSLTLDTNLAIADAEPSTITPYTFGGNTEVVLYGKLNKDGTFTQDSGTTAKFDFTSHQAGNVDKWYFKNLTSGRTDEEWFQDVTISFKPASLDNGYAMAQIDSGKSSILICDNPIKPMCLEFKPFGNSLQTIAKPNDGATYYIMDTVEGSSGVSLAFQFKLKYLNLG
jgi:hypothetical protein